MTDETTEDALFTKEDYEMYRGFINGLMRESEQDVFQWIESKTGDPATMDAFGDWLNLRKTGALRLEHKRLMLEYIQKDIDKIFEKKNDIIKGIAALGTFDPNIEAITFPGDATAIPRLAVVIAYKTACLLALGALMVEMELLLLDRWTMKDELILKPLI